MPVVAVLSRKLVSKMQTYAEKLLLMTTTSGSVILQRAPHHMECSWVSLILHKHEDNAAGIRRTKVISHFWWTLMFSYWLNVSLGVCNKSWCFVQHFKKKLYWKELKDGPFSIAKFYSCTLIKYQNHLKGWKTHNTRFFYLLTSLKSLPLESEPEPNLLEHRPG